MNGCFEIQDFGRKLRQLRTQRAMTQEEVAEIAGVSSRYVALIEAGARNPTLTVILDLAMAVGVEPHQLFME